MLTCAATHDLLTYALKQPGKYMAEITSQQLQQGTSCRIEWLQSWMVSGGLQAWYRMNNANACITGGPQQLCMTYDYIFCLEIIYFAIFHCIKHCMLSYLLYLQVTICYYYYTVLYWYNKYTKPFSRTPFFSLNSSAVRVLYISRAGERIAAPDERAACIAPVASRGLPSPPVASRGLPWSPVGSRVPPWLPVASRIQYNRSQ